MKKIVELKNITKSYITGSEKNDVIKGIDLTLEKNKTMAIVGPSGSGKSTLLNLIASLDKSDSGEIEVCGFDLNEINKSEILKFRNLKVGIVFQHHRLLPQLTVYENVFLPALPMKLNLNTKVDEILERLKIDHKKNFFPGQLSGGEKQRTAVARALINSPELLLADEPTGLLDKSGSDNLMELLMDFNKTGTAIIMVTHSDRAASYMDSIQKIENGYLQKIK